MSFKLDTSKFKKVKADKDSTTLQHESGHTLTIQHKPLSPKMRSQLSSIPIAAQEPKAMMAKGGKVEAPKMYDEGTPEQAVSKQDNAPVMQSSAGQPSQSPVTINIGQPMPQAQAPAPPVPAPMPVGSSQPAPQGAPPQDVSSAVGDPRGVEQPAAASEAPPQAEQMPQQHPAQAASNPGAPQDPYGVNATMGAFQKGAGEIESGAALGALAQQQQAQAQAQALGQSIPAEQQLLKHFEAKANDIQKHSQDALADYQAGHIEPEHYLENMSAGKKVMSAIGLILGGIGAGATHTSNQALDFLQKQIDRDVQAQRANLDKKANVFGGFMKMYGNERDAADMTTILRRNIVEDQMKKAAAQAQGTAAAAQMQDALGKWHTGTAQLQGQMASRQALLSGSSQGLIPPEMLIRTGVIPEAHAKDFEKQLGEAKNAVSLRDMTLNAFDQANKINTAGNRMLSPRQTQYQIDSLLGPVADKLTKDTSGRVTPETVKLIGAAFHTNWASPESVAKGRQSIVKLLSQGMHYPMLDAYQQDVGKWGAYDMNGNARIKERPPVIRK